MRKKLLFCFCITLLTAIAVVAQSRAVTNLDLDKYRIERLRAEADLRENYAKLGFSSPEEFERRREQSRVETEKLSAKLGAERMERERLDAELEAARFAAYFRSTQIETVTQDNGQQYYWSSGRRYRRPVVRGQSPTGYFAGGQFWPTGPATKPRPLFVRPRNR